MWLKMPLDEQEWEEKKNNLTDFDKIYNFLKKNTPRGYNRIEILGKAGVTELSIDLFSVLIYTSMYPNIERIEPQGLNYFRYKE